MGSALPYELYRVHRRSTRQMSFFWPTSHVGMLHPASIKSEARKRASDFVALANAAAQGKPYDQAKDLLDCSSNQAETRKSLFEELGLLYVPYGSNELRLTPVGKQLFELLGPTIADPLGETVAAKVDGVLIWALVNCQINRPQSFGSPRLSIAERTESDVRPYAAAWSIMEKLGGTLFLHELVGAVRTLQKTTDFDTCVANILQARSRSTLFTNPNDFRSGGPLMNDAIYWRSHLSGAFRFLDYSEHEQKFTFVPASKQLIDAALVHQRGCDEDVLASIRARTWHDPIEYFEEVGGRRCPDYLSSGKARIVDFAGEKLVLLRDYVAEWSGDKVKIVGGVELCSLPLRSACFHISSEQRLLRIDSKHSLASGQIEIICGLGRPVIRKSELLSLLSED